MSRCRVYPLINRMIETEYTHVSSSYTCHSTRSAPVLISLRPSCYRHVIKKKNHNINNHNKNKITFTLSLSWKIGLTTGHRRGRGIAIAAATEHPLRAPYKLFGNTPVTCTFIYIDVGYRSIVSSVTVVDWFSVD